MRRVVTACALLTLHCANTGGIEILPVAEPSRSPSERASALLATFAADQRLLAAIEHPDATRPPIDDSDTVRRLAGRLRACFRRTLREEPSTMLRATLLVRVEIDESGNASSSSVVPAGSTPGLLSPSDISCVLSVVRNQMWTHGARRSQLIPLTIIGS